MEVYCKIPEKELYSATIKRTYNLENCYKILEKKNVKMLKKKKKYQEKGDVSIRRLFHKAIKNILT